MSGKRIKNLTAATTVASTDQLAIDGTGFAEAKSVTGPVLFASMFGLNIAGALSITPQAVKVGLVSSALQVATTSVNVSGALTSTSVQAASFTDSEGHWQLDSTSFGIFDAAPVQQQTITGSTDSQKIASIIALLKAYGWASP